MDPASRQGGGLGPETAPECGSSPVTAKGRHDTALLLRGAPPRRPNLARSPGSFQPRPRLAREKRRRDRRGGGGWDERHQRESCSPGERPVGGVPRRRRDAAASSHAAGEVPHLTCALWTGRRCHPAPFPGREAFVSQPSINHAPMWSQALLALGKGRGMND